jgi:hypothetical protein
MKFELKIILTFVFMAFTALSLHTLNREIVVEQEPIGGVLEPQAKDLGFTVVAN